MIKYTALHFAVLTGSVENIAFLLSKGADPFLKNSHGDKPLDLSQDWFSKLQYVQFTIYKSD